VADVLRPHADHIAVLVHNAAALLIKPFDEITADDFERVWRVTCYGAFVASRIVVPHMAARKAGGIILTGATAALRGGPKFAAFASAKFALRGLAQSLSREFGPQGVHVAHVVLDGLIDEPQTEAGSGRPDRRAWIRTRSRKPISPWPRSIGRPGRTNWICAPRQSASEEGVIACVVVSSDR
jgi:NAD(P)-dependent dehydrogenase (short-subunit alcohol dehydrogenase family)